MALFVSLHGTVHAHGEHFEHSIAFDHALGVSHVTALAHAQLAHGNGFELALSTYANVLAFSTLALDEDASDGGGPRAPARVVDAYGNALAPSAVLSVELAPWLRWALRGGAALRASDDQALAEGEGVPFARALALETSLAALAPLARAVELEASAHGFASLIHDDVAFDAEGSLGDPIAASRYGASLELALAAGASHSALSATWLGARSLRAGAALIDVARGAALPYVPAFALRLEQALHAGLSLATERVELGAALALGVLGPRALDTGERTGAFASLDAAVSAQLRGWELALSIENLLDAAPETAEIYYASDLFESADAGARARSAAAGARAFLISVSTALDS